MIDLRSKSMLTSGDVASLMGVDIHTVRRWFDDKLIDGISLPGGHRRANRGAVIQFLKLKGYDPGKLAVPFLTEEEQIAFDGD